MSMMGTGGFSITMLPSASYLAGAITRFAGELRSLEEPLERARDEVLIPRIEHNFATLGDGTWADLARETPFMPYRQSHDAENAPTLQVTGTLAREAQQKNKWELDNQSGFIAMREFRNVPYASVHQFGATNRGLKGNLRDIPARPFVTLPDEDAQKIDEIFADFMSDKFHLTVAAGAISALASRV